MKSLKRIISIVLICAMIIPMGAAYVFAADPLTCDEAVSANWTPLAAKYSKSTNRIIAPKGDNYVIRTTGFDYSTDAEGGIKVHSPTYQENAGVYSVAAVASKYKTALNGLSIELMPDDITMLCDSNNASSKISFLVTEHPVTQIAGFDEVDKSYTTGLYNSVDVMTNGLRELAYEPGKSLVVTVSNEKISNTEDHIASTVSIVYDDGNYINKCDGRTGYRWVFTARNYAAESSVGDHSGICQTFEKIDFSDGLKLEVRADDRLGYIVTVNGKDYYDSTYIAYYPDCSVDTFYGKENNSYYLSDSDYDNLTDNYLNSMTYAQSDIDLTGLGEYFEGYVTVGATGTNITSNNCDFTVSEINGHAAATWQGESPCAHNYETRQEITKEPGCAEGVLATICNGCNNVIATEAIPAVNDHTPGEWITVKEPVCGVDGSKELHCSVCGELLETDIIAQHHIYTEDIIQASTCTEEGLAIMMCTCGDYYIADLPTIPHLFKSYKYNNDATCTEDGTKTAYCEYGCGVSDTITANGTASHSYVEEIIRFATCTKTGIMMMICDCGAYYTEDIPMLAHSYTDYVYNNDATCIAEGTMTAYCDYGCGSMDTLIAEGTKSDHSYTTEVTVAATCTATGIMTYTCEHCGDSYTETIPLTDHNYVPDVIKEPTCTSTGIILYMCECRNYYTETAPMAEHSFGDWSVTVAPTDGTKGEEKRSCSVCGTVETREISELPKPELTVDNYTITITNAEYIKDARYVLGAYTTTTEIRNAPGNVALDNKVIKNNTVEGSFVYDLPDGGVYSIWVRMNDGRNYILPIDMTKFTPAVDTYGVKITVDGLYDAKDFFIAKGQFNSYNEIKNNGYIVRVTENKIAGKHSYTYTVSEPGMHTVLVRYNDGTEHIFHEELTVDVPTFTTNGLQVTVGNIPDVKVIRTAYGEYYTPGDTKRAEGARNFSNKAVIKDAESYMLQYREEGRVTIIVEYNNGYVKVFHYDVVKKAPSVEQNENSVTFGNLDGLVMIRYAVGEYSTSAEIKRAPGSKVIKPDAIVDGKITVSELTIGETYTFCVQYDDDSYAIYTIYLKQRLDNARIIFWGDSFTQGILTSFRDVADVPYPERVGQILDVEVKNYGIGSEMAYQIAGRQGGLPVYAYATENDPFVIPADTTPVEICLYNEIIDELYWTTNFIGIGSEGLFQGINPISVGGILGEVKWVEGSNYTFTRLEAGEEIVFTNHVLVETFGMTDKREDDIVVIWVGHNDCPEADDTEKHDEIIGYIDSMIEYADTEKYLVLGLIAERYATGYAEINAKIKAHLESKGAGDKFLDVRTYLADPMHLEHLGITPNRWDKEWMERGWVPESLHAERMDVHGYSLHLNQMGYDILAQYVANKIEELGYLYA